MVDEDAAKTNELRDKQRQLEERLKELPRLEQERLDKAYTEGKLPRDYYEQRKRDVQSAYNHVISRSARI